MTRVQARRRRSLDLGKGACLASNAMKNKCFVCNTYNCITARGYDSQNEPIGTFGFCLECHFHFLQDRDGEIKPMQVRCLFCVGKEGTLRLGVFGSPPALGYRCLIHGLAVEVRQTPNGVRLIRAA